MIMEWFSHRRLSKLLLQEEKRKAALDAAKSGAVAVEATVVRIVVACVEYDDGDEEDMDGREVAAAIELAAAE